MTTTAAAIVVVLVAVVVVVAIYRRVLEHERARYDEIRRRERLRLLLRRATPRDREGHPKE